MLVMEFQLEFKSTMPGSLGLRTQFSNGTVAVLPSGWEFISELYSQLEMNSVTDDLTVKFLDPSTRGNRQWGFAYAAIAFTKDCVVKVWKPSIRKGTSKRDVKHLSTMSKMVHVIYGAGKFFTNLRRTMVFGKE